MRLLHQRHGDDFAGVAAQEPAPQRGADPQALANNLCRCGTHTRIVKAVQRARPRPRQKPLATSSDKRS